MRFSILKYDYKLIRKDPMLALSASTPFIFSAILLFAFPPIAEVVLNKWAYDIYFHYAQTGIFFLMLIPMIFGMVYGFILLDERDAGIITAISVTPFGKKKYLLVRMGIPMGFSVVVSALMLLLLNITPWQHPLQTILSSIILAFGTPIMLLFLGAFAGNKIEGMALSKSFSVMLIGVLVDFVAPPPWNWLGAFSPMFWIERLLLAETAWLYILYALCAIVFQFLILIFLYRKFYKRIG